MVLCLVTQLCPTLCYPWPAACQAPLSMEFSSQEYWSGVPCPPPGNLPNPGTEPRSPALRVDSLSSEPPGKPQILSSPNFTCHDIFTNSLPNLCCYHTSWLDSKLCSNKILHSVNPSMCQLVLSDLHALSHLILTSMLLGQHSPHLTPKKMRLKEIKHSLPNSYI